MFNIDLVLEDLMMAMMMRKSPCQIKTFSKMDVSWFMRRYFNSRLSCVKRTIGILMPASFTMRAKSMACMSSMWSVVMIKSNRRSSFAEHYRFVPARDACELGRMAEVEPLVFVADKFVEPSVFFKQIEVVQAGHEKDVTDPESHQILKALKSVAVAVFNPECVGGGSYFIEIGFQFGPRYAVPYEYTSERRTEIVLHLSD